MNRRNTNSVQRRINRGGARSLPRVLYVVAWLALSPAALPARPPDLTRSERDGLVPASDRDAESWLKRAHEAATQEDWKLAADTLSRIIDQFGDKTVSPDEGRHFFSAVHCAQEQIRQWPAEGLATYRLLYDPEVKQRLEAARRSNDLDALRQIARKYPYTTHGPDAINLLAAQLIDQRQPGEAIDLLQKLLELPHAAIPRWQTLQKLAIAHALAGDVTAAAGIVMQLQEAAATSRPKTADDKLPASRSSSADPAAPDDLDQRVQSLSSFLVDAKFSAQRAGATSRASVESWPALLGPPSAAGRMAPIDPAVSPETAVRDALPGAQRVNLAVVNRVMKRTGRPPVWQMVTDGRLLFATCPEGVLARDLATFDFLWKSVAQRPPRDRVIQQQRILMGAQEADNSDRLDETTTRTLFHEYRGAVSAALGLVFVVEQAGTPMEVFPSKEGVPPNNNIFYGDDFAEPNSLRAYEAETGRAMWTKGRGGPIDDGLRHAHFFAPPVPVPGHGEAPVLVAPFQLGADFQLAVIDHDGRLEKTILLGTGQPGMFPMNGVLPPIAHEGTLYVSTGAGMLIALSSYDFALRWQSPYERAPLTVTRQAMPRQFGPAGPATGGLAQPDEWLASPPLIVGPLVILAPPDSENLLAFERHTGQLKWSFPRGNHRYLIGADPPPAGRVYVAGTAVLALDVTTGQSKWAFDKATPTGRPALCGDVIYVPTEDALLRLSAATGQPVGEHLSVDENLGNLFAFDGALYSLTADSIAKFPDIERSRAIAEETLQREPHDLRSLLRLAYLAALKKDWPGALSLLDRADAAMEKMPSGSPDGQDLTERILHQRVTALIQLAAPATMDERSEYLTKAAASARRPDDIVKAGLALCELECDRGDLLAGHRRALALLKDHGDHPINIEEGLVSTSAVMIAQRMASIWASLSKDQRRPFVDEIDRLTAGDLAAMQTANPAPDAFDRLIRVSDGVGAATNGAALDLAIGQALQELGDDDSACFFLRRASKRALSNDPNSPIAFQADVRLAVVLSSPGAGLPAAQPTEARRIVERLRQTAALQKLPPDLQQIAGKPPPNSAAELLDQLSAVLPPPLSTSPPLPAVLRGQPNLELVSEDTAGQFPPDARSFDEPGTAVDLFRTVVPIRILKQIKGVAAAGSRDTKYYFANLLNMTLDDDLPTDPRAIELVAHPAAMVGSVAVLDAGSQVCAVGLTSGRMLWPALALDRTQGPLPDPPILQIDGTAIIAVDSATLIAVPARAHAEPIWKRRFPTRRLRTMAHVEGRLAVVDGDVGQLVLLDPASGRVQRQFALDAKGVAVKASAPANTDDTPDPQPPLAIVGKVVCVAGGRGVLARDVLTGQQLWTKTVSTRVEELRALDDRHVAIFHPISEMEIAHCESGEQVWRGTLEGLDVPPQEIALDWHGSGGTTHGRVLVFTKTMSETPRFMLQSIPLDSAGEPWQRDLGRFASINRQMLRASSQFVAAVQYIAKSNEDQPRRGDGSPIASTLLFVFDKATGRRLLESPYEFDFQRWSRGDGPSRLIKDVIVLDDRIIAVAPEGYYVLGRSERKPQAKADSEARDGS